MSSGLVGRTVALAEGRQLEELAQMLEKEGAVPLRCPMLSILDNPERDGVLTWLRQLIGGQFSYVVLMTGEALRRLVHFAETESLRDEMVSALSRTHTVTRGPKPVRALKEIGLTPKLIAQVPTTEGVMEALRSEPLQGRTVGLTLFGRPNQPLVDFLEKAGARVFAVMPYVYAPAADAGRVVDLIRRMAAGTVDVIVFTSSPQVDRLYEVADEHQLVQDLQQGLAKGRVAAVGPVVAENLRQRGARVDICPEQGFVMKNLVLHIKRDLAAQ
jgi:uroporphyrinogen-III synthase